MRPRRFAVSDGELLVFDTPTNLLRAAFGGDVDRRRAGQRIAADLDLRHRRVDGVVAPPERPRATSVADRRRQRRRRAQARLSDALDRAAASPVLDVRDRHVVDYDEAFVRIIERSRAEQPATT